MKYSGLTEFEADLTDCNLTDQDLIDILKSRPHLTKLILTSNPKLTSLSPVSSLSDLQVLVIGDTSIVDLSPLKNLVNIKHFDAEETKVSDISPLAKSTQLRSLILTSTQVDNTVLDIVSLFSELTKLSLSDTRVSGDISKLKSCTNLESLTLIDIDFNAGSLLELDTLQKLSFINMDPEYDSVKNKLMEKLPSLVKRELDDQLMATSSITTTQPLSPKLQFFRAEQTIIPNMLLEPFKECFEFAYMEITETISATDKNLFLNILQEGKLNCCQLVELSRKILIPETLISSICLCYCGLHPDKWDEFPGNLSDIKRNVLDNTVNFSLPLSPSEAEKEKCLSYLKKTAQTVCKAHFNDDIKLSPRHEGIKQSLITECAQIQQPANQVEASALIGGSVDLDKSLLKGYLLAYSDELNNIDKQAILTSGDLRTMIKSEIITEIGTRTKTSQLISSLNPEWKEIYDLIKFPPKYSRMRSERQMLGVVKAILYKIETGCFWSSLPQNFEEGGRAYYYYKTFQRENVLNKVLSIASKISTHEQGVEFKLE